MQDIKKKEEENFSINGKKHFFFKKFREKNKKFLIDTTV